MPTKISLVGTGAFQDPAGNPIAFGSLTAQLQEDIVSGVNQICAGITVTLNLDANGNIAAGSLWPAVYLFTVYTAQGQRVWENQINVSEFIPPLPVGQSYLIHPNGNIRFVNPAGIINTLGVPAFELISGLAIDSAGNLYVADTDTFTVYKITPSLGVTPVAGSGLAGNSGDGGLATACTFETLAQIALDPAGNLYIADSFSHRIRAVNMQSTTQTLLGVSVAPGCIETVVGGAGAGNTGDGGPATSAKIVCFAGMCVSASGLYFSTSNSFFTVRFVNQSGVINTVAGTAGTFGNGGNNGLATSATFELPAEIACDAAGNLYITDQEVGIIRVVNTQPTTQTLFGVSIPSGYINVIVGNGIQEYTGDGGNCLLAGLYVPQWVSFDVTGNLYVYQNNDSAIRMVNVTSQIITTVIGNGHTGFSGDGGLAVDAEINAILAPLAILQ